MVWQLLFYAVLTLYVASRVPGAPKAKRPGLSDINGPTADASRDRPVLFGEMDITSPNTVWYGDLQTKAIKEKVKSLFGSKKQTVGYQIYLGMETWFCRNADALTEIRFEDIQAWEGAAMDQTIVVDAPELLGGKNSRGGVGGNLSVRSGHAAQDRNPYMHELLGDGLPASRNIMSLVFENFYLGNSDTLPQLSIRARRTKVSDKNQLIWYVEKSTIPTCASWQQDPDGPAGDENYVNWVIPVVTGIPEYGTCYELVTADEVDHNIKFKTALVTYNDDTEFTYDVITYDHEKNILNRTRHNCAKRGDGSQTGPWMLSNKTGHAFVWAGENNAKGVWNPSPTGDSYGVAAYSDSTVSSFPLQPSPDDLHPFSSDTMNGNTTRVGTNGSQYYSIAGNIRKYLAVRGFSSIYYGQLVDLEELLGDPYRSYHMCYSGSLVWTMAEKEDRIKLILGTGYVIDISHYENLLEQGVDGFFIHKIGDTNYLFASTGASGAYINIYKLGDPTLIHRQSIGPSNLIYLGSGYFATAGAIYYVNPIAGTPGTFPTLVKEKYDQNPAHIIYEALTCKWGKRKPASKIDDTNFREAADTLYAEGFGLSFYFDRTKSIDEFIQDVLAHIDATLYLHPVTGLYTLKLIRDDYNLGDLVHLDGNAVQGLEDYSEQGFGELANQVTVNYYERSIRGLDSVVTGDTAELDNGQSVVPAEFDYPGITCRELASRVAEREYIGLVRDGFSCTVLCDRTGSKLYPGDPFILTSPKDDIYNAVMRVIKPEYGNSSTNLVKIACTTDKFHLPETAQSETGDNFELPPALVTDSQPVEHYQFEEMPYYLLVQAYGQPDADVMLTESPNAGRAYVSAARPHSQTVGGQLLSSTDNVDFATEDSIDYCPAATVDNAASISQTTETLQLTALIDMADVAAPTYAVWDNEHLRIDTITHNGGNNYIVTVGRGAGDSLPQRHDDGSVILFTGYGFNDVDQQLVAGQNSYAKILTETIQSRLLDALAPTYQAALNSRAIRPLPPQNVTINAEYWPEHTEGNGLLVEWEPGNRKEQATLHDWYDTGRTSEPGITYAGALYSAASGEEPIAEFSNETELSHYFDLSGGGGSTELSAMQFTEVANIDHLDVLPAGLVELVETFAADTGQYTLYDKGAPAATSITGNEFVITSNGASYTFVALDAATVSMPQVWVEADVNITDTGASSFDIGIFGIALAADTFIGASCDRINGSGRMRIQVQIGGSNDNLSSVAFAFPNTFKVGFSLVGYSACAWVDTGSGWQYVTGAGISAQYDSKLVGNLAGWRPAFGLAVGGGTSEWRVSNVRYGRHGGVGIRDLTLVTNEDGSEYRPTSDTVQFTCTLPDARGGGSQGVITLDLTTFSYMVDAIITVERDGKIQNDCAGHIIYYPNGDRRFTVTTWGNGFGNTLDILHKLEAAADLLQGSHVVSGMAVLALTKYGASPGAYSAQLAYDSNNARWLLAYSNAEDTAFTGAPVYPVAAHSSDLTSWTVIGYDNSVSNYEGTKLIRQSGSYFITTGSSNDVRIYNANTMQYVGLLGVPVSGGGNTSPQAAIATLGNLAYCVTFDGNAHPGTAGARTWGNLEIHQAPRFGAGSNDLTLELYSVRDGYNSHQPFLHHFLHEPDSSYFEDSVGGPTSIGSSNYDSQGSAVDSVGDSVADSSGTSITDSAGNSANPGTGTLQTYPNNNAVTNLYGSDRYLVTGTDATHTESLSVHKTVNNDYSGWEGARDYKQDANHWVKFNASGQVEVTITRLDNFGNPEPINHVRIQPEARNLPYVVNGNTVTITIDQPGPIAVAINDNNNVTQNINPMGTFTKQIVKEPLFLFVMPIDPNERTAADASSNLLYYGPGVHNIGKEFPLSSNTEVYIAGGAVVRGTFKCANNVSNIWIHGRGILSAKNFTETSAEHNRWGNHAIDMSTNTNGTGNTIEGITIVDPLRSCIVSYQGTDVSNVQLLSWSHRNDGITVGRNSSIEDCFIKVQDDNIKLFWSNVTGNNNVFWQQTAGAVFKLAWDLSSNTNNFNFTNTTIIRSDVFMDYSNAERDRGDLNSTSALFSCMGIDGGVTWSNGVFDGINIEEENYIRLIGLRGRTWHGGKYWGESGYRLITGLTIKNLTMPNAPVKKSFIYANDGLNVNGVHLENWNIAANDITNINQLPSQNDGNGITLLTSGSGAAISDVVAYQV